MQKHRKVAAHRGVALGGEVGGGGAHDHPVPLADRAAEQTVTNRTAYQVHLHRPMLTESRKLLTVALLLAVVCVLPGCGSLYLLQAASGQAQILVARRPIAAVMADPKTSPALRAT